MVDDMSQYLAGFHCLVACQLYYFTPNLTSEDQLYHFQPNLHTRYLPVIYKLVKSVIKTVQLRTIAIFKGWVFPNFLLFYMTF